MSKQYNYAFVLGDDSGDGHSMTDLYYLVTDCPPAEMHSLNQKVLDYGMDALSEDYECCFLSEKFVTILKTELNIFDQVEQFLWQDKRSPSTYSYSTSSDYFNIYLAILRRICSEYTFNKLEEAGTFAIGGYGVFGS